MLQSFQPADNERHRKVLEAIGKKPKCTCRATDRRTEPLILFESGAFLLPAEGDCTPSLQQVMRHSLLDLPQVS